MVSELIELGLLRERGIEHRGSAGRPGVLVEVARAGAVGLGMQIGIDSLALRASDLAGGTRYRATAGAANRIRRPEAVLDHLAEMARDALVELEKQGLSLVGATVAVPGLVDIVSGVVHMSPDLDWRDVPVVDYLNERIGKPELRLHADNEGSLAALGELSDLSGVGRDDFMLVSGAVGVAAGIVAGGELVRGARGFGAAFGHVTVEPNGRLCRCGSRGCLETRVGREALLTAAGLGDGSMTDLLELARSDEPHALAALADCGRWLGIGLATVANLLAPQAYVLSGHFADLAPWLIGAVEDELRSRVLSGGVCRPEILTSRLGLEATLRGAAVEPIRRVLAAPRLEVLSA